MHDDDVQRLRTAIADVWDSGGRRFVTVEDADDEDAFVQYIDGQVNVAWPFEDEPEIVLEKVGAQLPGAAFVASYTPGATAILAVGDLLQDEVVTLVARLVERVLEADEVAVRVDSDR